jgi:hypothetical protein
MIQNSMVELSLNDKMILLQYAIDKFETENILIGKLKEILTQKEIDRMLDTLIGTQQVRRIGTDVLQNNTSHTGELQDLPDHLKQIIEKF